jgi:hypothetical protein
MIKRLKKVIEIYKDFEDKRNLRYFNRKMPVFSLINS